MRFLGRASSRASRAAVQHSSQRVPSGARSDRAAPGRTERGIHVFARFGRVARAAVIVLACLFLLGAGDPTARFNNLGHKLMCRCGCNQILLECNHVGCQYSEKMRNELLASLQGPDSDDLILQAFVQKYGAVVLAAPTTTGFNRVAWIAPFAALLAGILAMVYVVLRWKRRALAAPATSPPAGLTMELEAFREKARKETEL